MVGCHRAGRRLAPAFRLGVLKLDFPSNAYQQAERLDILRRLKQECYHLVNRPIVNLSRHLAEAGDDIDGRGRGAWP